MSFQTNTESVIVHPPGSGAGAPLSRLHIRFDSTDSAFYLTGDAPPPPERAGFVASGGVVYTLQRNEQAAPALRLVANGQALIRVPA
jgi:hypothetical protein